MNKNLRIANYWWQLLIAGAIVNVTIAKVLWPFAILGLILMALGLVGGVMALIRRVGETPEEKQTRRAEKEARRKERKEQIDKDPTGMGF